MNLQGDFVNNYHPFQSSAQCSYIRITFLFNKPIRLGVPWLVVVGVKWDGRISQLNFMWAVELLILNNLSNVLFYLYLTWIFQAFSSIIVKQANYLTLKCSFWDLILRKCLTLTLNFVGKLFSSILFTYFGLHWDDYFVYSLFPNHQKLAGSWSYWSKEHWEFFSRKQEILIFSPNETHQKHNLIFSTSHNWKIFKLTSSPPTESIWETLSSQVHDGLGGQKECLNF